MSESGEAGRTWHFYLDDMLEFARKAETYTRELEFEDFLNDSLTYDATIRNLELIGEAARNIPEHIRSKYPDIPWRQMMATRNRLIHAYLGIDDDTVWSIVTDDIPELIRALEKMRSSYYPDGDEHPPDQP